jgi:hypothetical protein
VPDVVVFCIFLSYFALVLLSQSSPEGCQFRLEAGLPLPVVFAALASQALDIIVSLGERLFQFPRLRCQNLIFFGFYLEGCFEVDGPGGECLDLVVFVVGEECEFLFFCCELCLLDGGGGTMMAAHSRYMFSFSFPRSFTACLCRQLYFSRHI